MKEQGGMEAEGEEDTTLSWSSSISISPDSPVFQGSSTNEKKQSNEEEPEAQPAPNATQKSEHQQKLLWNTATQEKETRESDDEGPMSLDDDTQNKKKAEKKERKDNNSEYIIPLDEKPHGRILEEAKANTDHQAEPNNRVVQAKEEPGSTTTLDTLVAANAEKPSTIADKLFCLESDGSDSEGLLLQNVLDEDDDDDNEEQLRTMEEQVRLGEQLHHMRMPSTIMEENPLTVEEDEDSSPSDDDEQQEQKQPLLSPLEKKTTSFTDLLKGMLPDSTTTSPANSQHGQDRTNNLRSFGKKENPGDFTPHYLTTKFYEKISQRLLRKHYTPFAAATWIGFWALLHVTCANYVLTPMRDAIALQVGVQHMPKLTLASTVLAFCSSVPIGWLFEAPDPSRRRVWKRMGLTRGETQGTSLALFYRCFALILISYAVGFQLIELLRTNDETVIVAKVPVIADSVSRYWPDMLSLWTLIGQILYIAFFLVVHLMKLHSLSLVWGVTTEAMEYEEVARKRSQMESSKTRLQRLALVGFGGTVGGILGSMLASSMAQILRLPGLLVLAALLLEVSAELSIEMGRIMQKHWEEQQLFQSSNDLASLDSSMKRSASLGSMKRVASGNSLNRVKSTSELNSPTKTATSSLETEEVNDNTFFQRLLRGVTTILRSRLLMAIFTYNALYASTSVLLSFQRAALVANRNESTTTEKDTAFLANVNMASSIAVFVLQASGLGASLAHMCGSRGTLALMPMVRFVGVISLAWWHRASNGQPPNLITFLVVDECCRIMNLAVAKPVRESLWRGLSNEARYEAKPIVDTLANRWGGGSAAFLVSFINKALDLFGVEPDNEGVRMIFGFPPIIFLCIIIAAWWTAVSADLGHVRSRIDMELKKRQ